MSVKLDELEIHNLKSTDVKQEKLEVSDSDDQLENLAVLALEDGRIFRGYGFGATRQADGEVVFNTSMTGYQEICTDPSYRGEIVCLTYPIIGNYGVTHLDDESREPWISGLIVREYSHIWSNWRGETNLHRYLQKHNIPAIQGVDTRALTRHLRSKGLQRGVIVRVAPEQSDSQIVELARRALMPGDKNVVGEVTTPSIYRFPARPFETLPPTQTMRVAVIDCGLKENILNSMSRRGIEATVVPYNASLSDILALNPDAVFTSPGPGDPERNSETIETLKGIITNQVPFFGICLGHQLLGLAIGATTSRLKFGHRGGNHPVKDLISGQVYITAQNHGFQVDAASVPTKDGWRVSQLNLHDNSVEGLAHSELPAFTVQYHPEGSPGPQDNQYLFDRFLALVQERNYQKHNNSY